MLTEILCSSRKADNNTHSATGASPGNIQFLEVTEIFFSNVNRSAVLFKEVFPTERLCHSCERWWVALTTYTFRNKLGITAKESSLEPLISAEVSV